MKRKRDLVVDVLFLAALAAVFIWIAVSGCGRKAADEPAEATQQATVAATEAVCEEPVMEAVSEEDLSEEPVGPEAVLFDVPLDVSLQAHIVRQAEMHGLDPAIIVAMCWKESTYRHDAIGDGGNSFGLCQVQVKWHYARMLRLGCTNLLDPYQNVTVAVDYLAELLGRYGSIDKALTAYNRGSYSGTVSTYANQVITYAEQLRK